MQSDLFIHNDIYLRPLEPEDLDVLYKWENDTRLWNIGSTISPFSRFTLKKYIVDSHDDIFNTKQLRMMIVEKKSDDPVGTIDLYEFDSFSNRAGIGVLIDESYRGNGYASQAVDCMESYAFGHLNIFQLYVYVPETNTASLALFSGSGYQRTAVLKKWLRIKQDYVDVVVKQKFNPDF